MIPSIKPSRTTAGPARSIIRMQRLQRQIDAQDARVDNIITDLDAAVATLATKLGDAPSNGSFYARKDGAWVVVTLAVLPAS